MLGSYTLAQPLDGNSHPPVPAVLDDAEFSLIARTDASILFTGRVHVRTLALKIHNLRDVHGTFRAVDCGAASHVLESELFGVLENDALLPKTDVSGRATWPGTLFLHEVGNLTRPAQARLRDAIALASVGTPAPRLRRRIIASTSDPLLPRVVDGTFDDRLFYMLNVMHFDVGHS